jgi:acyl-CoA synthetase (AMP-forming)/AMP-acid ligase II
MPTTAELIRRGAAQHRDRTAILWEDDELSFADVFRAACRIGNALTDAGIGKGAHVALLVGNGPHSASTDFGLVLNGQLRVPLNARLSLDEHVHMLEQSRAGVLVHDAALAGRAAELVERVPGLRCFGHGVTSVTGEPDVLAHQDAVDRHVDVAPDDPVLLLFTSGTTGTLKAVVHTQGTYAAIAANMLANLIDPRPGSTMLHAASLIHASGTFVLPYWVRGGTSAVLPGFDPSSFASEIARYQATEINLVPTMIGMLLGNGTLGRTDLSSLRQVIYGASPMPRPILAEALERFGPIMWQYYGQTEAPLCMTVLTPDDHRDPSLWGACGQPAVEADLRLVDDEGSVVAGEGAGEIQVRAPFAMAGYFDADELNAEMRTQDGWLRTRDVARRDAEGYLHLIDRTSDMIITGGYNVYPREVEDVLLSHPAVAECAVVGAPDPTWVEAVTAYVSLKPGGSVAEAELIQHVRSRLAPHKTPKAVHVVDGIPKSPVGKVLRRALRDPLWKDQPR